MLIKPGTTDVSYTVQVVDDGGIGVTGLVAATFPALTIVRSTGAAVAFSALSDLASLASAHADGGVKERGGGFYRLDGPDSIAATPSPDVRIVGEQTGKHVICPPIEVAAKYVPQVRICSKTTAGATLQLMAWLEADGQVVDLSTLDATAECVVTCFLHGSGVAQFEADATDFGNPTTEDVFEFEVTNPALTADRIYDLQVEIDFLGTVYRGRKTFTAVP